MNRGIQFWKDKIPAGFITKRLRDGRTIETFPDMPLNLYQFLEQSAGRFPLKEAVSDDLGRTMTYSDLKDRTDRFAQYLGRTLALPRGAHIAVMAYSTVEYITAFLAVNKIGAAAVILPTKFQQEEITSLAGRSDLDCIICDGQFAHWFDGYRDRGIPVVDYLPCPENFALDRFRPEAGDARMPCRAEYEDVCALMFTSGTTSLCKGVMLTNYNFVHAAGVYRMAFDLTEQDRTIIPVPVYTITALSAVIGTFLLVGGTICLQRRFNARQVLQCILDHELTYMHAAPTVCSLLMEEREHFPSLPSLRRIVCGGSRMPAEKIRRLHDWLPDCEYHNVYGMTETTSPAAIQRENAVHCREMASEGFTVPGLCCKVTDEDGKEVPQGETGEIRLSGACIMQGYYRLETDSFQEGWLATGDMGYFTPEGYLYVTDRKKDMINRGGEKMTSFDVEESMYRIRGISEAVVVGIPDELYGEVPAALVKAEKDAQLDENSIREYLHGKIAKYKIPVRILFTDSIPLSTGGKPDRNKIREMLSDAGKAW